MKSLRYLCISLILLTITNEAVACWGPWYTPKGYYMYRVYNNLPDPTIDIEKQNPNEGKNCEEWQKLTSETIPLEDIYQVVYKMDLESFEALYDNRGDSHENKFIEWITQRIPQSLIFYF